MYQLYNLLNKNSPASQAVAGTNILILPYNMLGVKVLNVGKQPRLYILNSSNQFKILQTRVSRTNVHYVHTVHWAWV